MLLLRDVLLMSQNERANDSISSKRRVIRVRKIVVALEDGKI